MHYDLHLPVVAEDKYSPLRHLGHHMNVPSANVDSSLGINKEDLGSTVLARGLYVDRQRAVDFLFIVVNSKAMFCLISVMLMLL